MAFARTERTGPSRLVNRIKIAYWAALLIIAAMSGASFLLLNDMLTGLQRDNAVLAQAADQKRITQRIVTLADAALRAARTQGHNRRYCQFSRPIGQRP